jgi:hypothetical protein
MPEKWGGEGDAAGRHPVTAVAGFIAWGSAVECCSPLLHGAGIVSPNILKHSGGKEKVTLLMLLSSVDPRGTEGKSLVMSQCSPLETPQTVTGYSSSVS